jgi:pescadillo protein
MGKLIKKGTEGESSKYLTKGKAMRKLQLNTQQFHRLCILKGVYPRDPKKKKDPSKTYYHIKDIKFLAHEGLLEKFREIDAWLHKLRKAKIRKDLIKAEKISENMPKYSLTHLVKERYPRFIDALHDLDDALSLLCLFASCPSNADLKICN